MSTDNNSRVNEEKTEKEEVIDNLLLIYLIDVANRKGAIEGNTKLQKLVFLTEHSMLTKRVKGFNYRFFKYLLGPFSKELAENIGYLIINNIVSHSLGIKLEDRGKEVLNICKDLFSKNRVVKQHIDKIVDDLASEHLQKIVSIAYETEIKYPIFKEPKKVKNIPLGWDLILKLNEKEADEIFKIEDEISETLSIYFDKEFFQSMEEAIEDVRKGRLLTHRDVFKGV